MARSIGYCCEHHPVIAFFGWDCPLCAFMADTPIVEDPLNLSIADLQRAVVNDYNRLFFVHDDCTPDS